jgi:hypothetical protein
MAAPALVRLGPDGPPRSLCQLSPAADIALHMLTAASCQRTNPLTRERAAREGRS